MEIARNFWYPILEARSCAGASAKPIALTRFGVKLVLWRDRSGVLVGMHDRCPHRRVALSLGTVRGDTLECAYHAFRYDTLGRCTVAPALGSSVNQAAHLRATTVPVRERYGYVWLWWGDAEPDETIPWFPELSHERHDVPAVSVHYPASFYRVMESNFDAYHVPHLHRRTGARVGATVKRCDSTTRNGRIDTETVLEDPTSGASVTTQTSVIFPALTWARTPEYGTSTLVAVSPIDERSCWFSAKLFHRSMKRKMIGRLLRHALNFHLQHLVLPEDFAIQASQEPADSGIGTDRLIKADAGIAAYWQLVKAWQSGSVPR